MKKLASVMLATTLALGFASAAPAFTATDEITVMSREDGSGTRGAFVELLGIVREDDTGERVDRTTLEAIISNSTAVMLTGVSRDEAAIGYVSIGVLSDRVKALAVDGTAPTREEIKAGEYKVSRPFTIATLDAVSAAAEDFIAFILSAEGQRVVEETGYIAAVDGALPYAGGATGKIVIAGSSSVTPVMEKLKEAYTALNAGVQMEVLQSDSTTGLRSVENGIADIGMASRALADSERAAGLRDTAIAIDGIAIIVNNENPAVDLSSETLRKIFTGEIITWAEAGIQ